MRYWILLGCLWSAFHVWAEPLDKIVAVVNHEVITERELDAQVDLLRQQFIMKKVDIPSSQVLKKQVLQHLIDVNLQLQLAKQNGIQVSDKELDETIARIAERNHFDIQQFKTVLLQQGMSWQQYRDNLKKDMMMAQLQQRALGKEIVVTKAQVDTYLKEAQLRKKVEKALYHVQNIVIPLPLEPTSEMLIRARHKAEHIVAKLKAGADFNQIAIAESSEPFALEGGDLGERHLAELPEIFAKEVVNMKAGDIAGPIRTGNGFQVIKLNRIAATPLHHWVQKTHVRHILIKAEASMTQTEAEAQREHLYQQLHSGASFAKLAKQYSLDPVSAIKGGDLGWVAPGDLVQEIEKAMELLPLYTVSRPIQSRFGWHFIEVLGRKMEDDTQSYERDQVRQLLKQRKFTEALQAWQQRLRGESYVQIMDKSLVG